MILCSKNEKIAKHNIKYDLNMIYNDKSKSNSQKKIIFVNSGPNCNHLECGGARQSPNFDLMTMGAQSQPT